MQKFRKFPFRKECLDLHPIFILDEIRFHLPDVTNDFGALRNLSLEIDYLCKPYYTLISKIWDKSLLIPSFISRVTFSEVSHLTLATRTPWSRAKPTKLTEGTRGDSQGQRTTLRRTSTVPEESKPPPTRSNDQPAADGPIAITNTTTTTATNVATEMHAEQSNGSPDSILSGPLEEGGNSAPDSSDSAPTVPFPPISNSPSSFATSEPEPRNRKSQSRASGQDRRNTDGGGTKEEQRAFGSPVSVDDDDARFWDRASPETRNTLFMTNLFSRHGKEARMGWHLFVH